MVPPRTRIGRPPVIAHHSAQQNVWLLGGMGSRGLLYHAHTARLLMVEALRGVVGGVMGEVGGVEGDGERDGGGEGVIGGVTGGMTGGVAGRATEGRITEALAAFMLSTRGAATAGNK